MCIYSVYMSVLLSVNIVHGLTLINNINITSLRVYTVLIDALLSMNPDIYN